jgi:N-dimethylarginine dimethylaminohydrolase
MTDPRHFAIRGGANPHTRNTDQSLKSVDGDRAWDQWHSYVDALLDGGIEVYIAEARPELTGMVFAANAGLIPDRLADRPASEKIFYPSHFRAEHRRPETERYRDFMRGFGFEIGTYDENLTFEGEADAFPVRGDDEWEWCFTWGFRSDPEVGDWLEGEIFDRPVHRFELTDPHYYHGDCLLCELGGPVLAWSEGLADESAAELRDLFEDRLIEMDDGDGANFIGNSFYVETDSDRLLYTPREISASLRSRIESSGVDVVPVDVSEFFGKGGGGPKCLVFNLGRVDRDAPELLPAVRDFRRRRHVEHLRRQDYF